MQAADSARDGDVSPPYLLRKAWRIDRWGAPVYGGTDSWLAGLSNKMAYLDNIYTVYKNRFASSDVMKWIENNPDLQKLYTSVEAIRRELKDNKEN